MAKLTIEIDMDESQDSWDALYRQIEEFEQEQDEKAKGTGAAPVTYDLLLDPDHNFREISDFFAVFRGHD